MQTAFTYSSIALDQSHVNETHVRTELTIGLLQLTLLRILSLNQNTKAITISFLGAFAKLRKATNSFSCLSVHLSVRPSVRMEQLGFHWTNFREI